MTADENNDVVSLKIRTGFGIITIDNPPVNAGSTTVRTGILEALADVSSQDVQGVIIIGAGRTFIAGSDIREFGAPLVPPELPQVIAAIEDCPHPVCAAIHGAALGGGFELALGCDLRVATPDAVLGLPEVTLGMVPGAGGSQRLPRLVGIDTAISLVCSGRRVPASEAKTLGMIDALADTTSEDALVSAGIAAIQAAPVKRKLRDLPAPPADPQAVKTAEAAALRRGKGRPNVSEAIRLVKLSETLPAQEALAQERGVFQNLRVSEDAFALRHLFFAERAATRIDGIDAPPNTIKRVGLVGGGTMGQGICRAVLAAGLPVTLIERDPDSRDRTALAMQQAMDGAVSKGRITAQVAQHRMDLLTVSDQIQDLADCDLVLEAVFEDMAIKKDLFRSLDAILKPGAILASNTSYLDIDDMASVTSRPGNVVGLHFFSPADVMKLLEVVRAKSSSQSTLATAFWFAKFLKKQAVVSRVAEGFIGNRIYAAYRRQAEFLVEDGATPEDVDKAATEFGFAMGPFAVGDMSGLDIAWNMRKRQAATRNPDTRYVDIPDWLCEAGRFGRKTKGGYYDYINGKVQPSAITAKIIADARAAKGITPRKISPKAIQDRLIGAILNEAALVLKEGVAQRPSDIDVTLVHGYGFPRWTGGPLWWASGQTQHSIADMSDGVAVAAGTGHVSGDIEDMIALLREARQDIDKRKLGHA